MTVLGAAARPFPVGGATQRRRNVSRSVALPSSTAVPRPVGTPAQRKPPDGGHPANRDASSSRGSAATSVASIARGRSSASRTNSDRSGADHFSDRSHLPRPDRAPRRNQLRDRPARRAARRPLSTGSDSRDQHSGVEHGADGASSARSRWASTSSRPGFVCRRAERCSAGLTAACGLSRCSASSP